MPEAIGTVFDQLGAVLFDLTGQGAALCVTGQVHARGADGQDAGGYRLQVHPGDRDLRVPGLRGPAPWGQTAAMEELAVRRRNHMLVGVDACGRGHGVRLSRCGRTSRLCNAVCRSFDGAMTVSRPADKACEDFFTTIKARGGCAGSTGRPAARPWPHRYE